jgi:hypothetical protein
VLLVITASVQSVAAAGDGRLLASGGAGGTVRLWEERGSACLRVLRVERRYERLDITVLTGVVAAPRAALLALGAVERDEEPPLAQAPHTTSAPR